MATPRAAAPPCGPAVPRRQADLPFDLELLRLRESGASVRPKSARPFSAHSSPRYAVRHPSVVQHAALLALMPRATEEPLSFRPTSPRVRPSTASNGPRHRPSTATARAPLRPATAACASADHSSISYFDLACQPRPATACRARLASTPRQRGHESPRAAAAAAAAAGSAAVLGYGSGIYPEPYTGSGDGWAQPGSLARSFELKPAATPFAAAEAAAPLVKRAASAASASAAEAAKTSASAANRLAGRARLAEDGIYIYLGGSDAEVQALATLPSPRGGSPKARRDRAASAAKRATAAATATASAAASAAKAIKERTGWDPMEHAATAAAAAAAEAAEAAAASAALAAYAVADAAAAQRRAAHLASELQPPYPPRTAEGQGEGAPRGEAHEGCANGGVPTGRGEAKAPRYQRAAELLLGDGNAPSKESQPASLSPVLPLADPAGGYGVRAAAPPGSYSPRAALLRTEAEMEAEMEAGAEASVSATTRRGTGNGVEAKAAAKAAEAEEAEEEEEEEEAAAAEPEPEPEPEPAADASELWAGAEAEAEGVERLRAAEVEAEAAAVAGALAMTQTMAEVMAEAEEEAGVAEAVNAGAPRKYLHAQRLALSISGHVSADVHEMQELREAQAEADVQEDRRSRRASKEAAYPTPRGRPLSSYSMGAMGSSMAAADAEAVLVMLRGLRIFQDMSDDALKAVMARASVLTLGRDRARCGQPARAQAPDWPRLAGAWGSLERDLALREASGEPAGRGLRRLAFDTGAHLPALLGGGARGRPRHRAQRGGARCGPPLVVPRARHARGRRPPAAQGARTRLRLL